MNFFELHTPLLNRIENVYTNVDLVRIVQIAPFLIDKRDNKASLSEGSNFHTDKNIRVYYKLKNFLAL